MKLHLAAAVLWLLGLTICAAESAETARFSQIENWHYRCEMGVSIPVVYIHEDGVSSYLVTSIGRRLVAMKAILSDPHEVYYASGYDEYYRWHKHGSSGRLSYVSDSDDEEILLYECRGKIGGEIAED